MEMSTLCQLMNVAQPHRLGWEVTTIPTRAAVTNDAMARFTDELRA